MQTKTNKYENYTREQLFAEIEKLSKRKKYGLVWEEEKTKEQFEKDAEGKLPVLVEDKKREIKTDPKKPVNILIEGDNYHALSVLNYTHRKSIDVIYIDPPYNTGNNDFIYNDKYVEGEDSYRHSKWLSFMSKRLKLAKNLLKDTGVIFISIDDNEVAQLKLLCDEIFGEQNGIGIVCWFKKRKGSFLSNKLVSVTEYLLPYKRIDTIKLFGGETNKSESQPLIKRTNTINELKFPLNFVKTKLNNGIYKKGIYGIGSSASELLNSITVKDGIILNEFKLKAPFTWSQDFLDDEIENGTQIIINTKNLQPRAIRVNNDSTKGFSSFIDGREFKATNEDAYQNLKDIFQTDRPFNYSKPVNLIKRIINSVAHFNKNVIVLDFFAGSGTTAQAILELNKENNTNGQFILCTNNEDNNSGGLKIATDICYPRIKKVIEGYKNPKGEKIKGLGGNLKYYKTDFVGSEPSHRNKKLLTDKSIEMLCIKENTFEEVLKTDDYIFFRNKEWHTAILLNEIKMEVFKNEVKKLKSPVSVFVFSLEGDDHDLIPEFIGLKNVLNLGAIPEVILKVYRRIYEGAKQKYYA